ncbi:MAG: hypothetical protein K8H90_05005, partial [Thermoanaerobaculia bacterium]|nr:hypothetical protein [Thermoanaerobaculia bacterium]
TLPATAQATAADDPNETLAPDVEPIPERAPLAAGAQYRHVAGSAFVPLYADSGATYGSKGCTYMTAATHLYSNYSLDLRHESIVTAVRLYFNDTAPTDGTLHLARYDDGGSYTYLASVSTEGSAGWGVVTTSGLQIQLDYVNYNYVLYWMPGVGDSTMQLCGFRVSYFEPSIFLDGFESGNFLAWDLDIP